MFRTNENNEITWNFFCITTNAPIFLIKNAYIDDKIRPVDEAMTKQKQTFATAKGKSFALETNNFVFNTNLLCYKQIIIFFGIECTHVDIAFANNKKKLIVETHTTQLQIMNIDGMKSNNNETNKTPVEQKWLLPNAAKRKGKIAQNELDSVAHTNTMLKLIRNYLMTPPETKMYFISIGIFVEEKERACCSRKNATRICNTRAIIFTMTSINFRELMKQERAKLLATNSSSIDNSTRKQQSSSSNAPIINSDPDQAKQAHNQYLKEAELELESILKDETTNVVDFLSSQCENCVLSKSCNLQHSIPALPTFIIDHKTCENINSIYYSNLEF
jgi:hypothetical protein